MGSASTTITRLSLFKIPSPADQERTLSLYKDIPQKAKRDGKPYVLSLKGGLAEEDQRSQGFTVAVIAEYKSLDDMKYWDSECPAHMEIKKVVGPVQQGVMIVYLKDQIGFGGKTRRGSVLEQENEKLAEGVGYAS